MRNTNKIFYRVDKGGAFADSDFNTLEEAIDEIANPCQEDNPSKEYWHKMASTWKILKITQTVESV